MLGCPIMLEQRDFIEALHDWSRPVDIAWIGLSLHHLVAPAKLTLIRKIRGMRQSVMQPSESPERWPESMTY